MRHLLRERHQPALKLTAVAAGILLLAAGCGGSAGGPAASAGPGQAAVPCASPPPASGPDVAGTLGPDDNGATVCLARGQRLSVFLSVTVDQATVSPWSPIKASAGGILRAVPSGALTLVRGVTAGIFEAAGEGTVHLESTRRGCGEPASPCTPDHWSATVVVGR